MRNLLKIYFKAKTIEEENLKLLEKHRNSKMDVSLLPLTTVKEQKRLGLGL